MPKVVLTQLQPTTIMVFLENFVSENVGLTKLPPYLSTFYWSFFGFVFVHQVIAPYASKYWFSTAYAGKSKATKSNWCMHVASQVHVAIIVPFSLWCVLHQGYVSDEDKVFGWFKTVGYVHAIACGYFLWDTLDAIVNFTDAGFVVHGITCLSLYVMSYKPFVAYFGTRCLLWEASTFFLNNHWFLDKTGRTGTRIQLINGFALLGTFFLVRLVYGGYISIQFFYAVLEVRDKISYPYIIIYEFGNLVLQGLNWFWFFKMIAALRKRFQTSEERTTLLGPNQLPSQVNQDTARTNGTTL